MTNLACRLFAAALLSVLASAPAAAQPEVRLPTSLVELETEAASLRLEIDEVDLAGPTLLTVVGGVAAVGGLVISLAGVFAGASFGGLGPGPATGSGEGPDERLMVGGGILAGVGALTAISSGIWLGVRRYQTRPQRLRLRELRRFRRDLRRSERGLSWSLVPHGAGLGLRLSF